jgi:hypothetical protein
MATLKEVSGKLESVRDGQSVQSKVLIDGQENQTKVQTSNSEALKGVMENVVMRVGRSENLLSQMFGHLGYIRRNLSKGGSNTSGDDLESRNETKIWQSSLLEAIQNIGASKEEDDPKKDDKPSEMLTRLGLFASLAAVAMGTLAGSIAGLFKPLGAIIKFLTPKFISKIVKFPIEIGKAITQVFMTGLGKVREGFTFVGKMISGWGTKLKVMFTESKLGQVIAKVSERFKSFMKPFEVLGKTLSFAGGSKTTGPIAKVMEFFQKLGTKFGSFAKTLGSVFKVVSKIFAPLAAAFIVGKNIVSDLMSGEFGFGTLKNIIDDLLKFFVVDLADMVKDAISWVSEKLGFEKFSAFLDSFSFGAAYESIKEGIANFIDSPVEFMKEVFTNMTEMMARVFKRAKEVFSFANLAILIGSGGESGKGLDYLLNGKDDISAAGATNKPTGSNQLNSAVKENDVVKATANIVMMDNSSRTSAAPAASAPAPVLVASNNSADPFDQGRSV